MKAIKKLPERNKFNIFFLNLGKLILDATKLSFASLVLGTIIKGNIPPSILLIAGIIVSVVGTTLGILFITMNEEK